MTILDVVKHAVRTIIASLAEDDALAIVVFSTSVQTLLRLTPMHAAGKARANQVVKDLDANGNTNLWGGLKAGLDLLRDTPNHRHGSVFLLTDGEPNVIPPRGHLPMLRQYINANGLPGAVNTFGFGYSLDSGLLNELAVAGSGTYAFIPDASFVGTVFIHSTTSILATFATKVRVTVVPLGGAVLAQEGHRMLGGHRATVTPEGIVLDAVSLRFDQSKELVLQMKNLPAAGIPYAKVAIEYCTPASQSTLVLTVLGTAWDADRVAPHIHRLQFVDVVYDGLRLMKQTYQNEAMAAVQALARDLQAATMSHEQLKPLLEDVDGQVTLAFSPEAFAKWGKHYLPSLAAAHLHQFCNNFKDPGVQPYATGALFETLRDAIDAIFCELPPPSPSGWRASQAQSAVAPVSMRTFNNADNPCFVGDSLLLMADGSSKAMRDVRKGDGVRVAQGRGSGCAAVECVVVSPCASGETSLVTLPTGLRITPWHPIHMAGEWQFPADMCPPMPQPCSAVYNLILDSGHVVVVDGVECATLGHGLQEPVVQHEFFGTNRVVDSLRTMAGWPAGLVWVAGTVRDAATGLVCGLQEATPMA